MSYGLVVTIRTKPETRTAFMEKLAANAAAARAEPGCLTFDVLVHPDDPDQVMLYEIYKSEAAFKEHQGTEAFKAYLAEAVPLLADRGRTFMTRISH
jgi:quinol monooxygenase YgiN